MSQNLKLILSAADFAAHRHRNQTRKGENGIPYINHPIEVARLLSDVGGVSDTDILIAALLHDTIEDTDTTESELEQLFGIRATSFVVEVTDDKTLPKPERKRLQIEHAPGLSIEAQQIKIADKISNVQDVTRQPPADWDVSRRIEYVEWGTAVVAGLRGCNQDLEVLFDIRCKEALESISKS